jgi:hypothetical protein
MLKQMTFTAAAAVLALGAGFGSSAQAADGSHVLDGRSCGEAFNLINHSGAPYKDEHIDVTEALSFDMPDDAFQTLDADNDMMISRSEFVNCQASQADITTWMIVVVDNRAMPASAVNQYKICDYRFDVLNENPAADEHMSIGEASKMSSETFARLDTDNSRTLTRDEFKNCQLTL